MHRHIRPLAIVAVLSGLVIAPALYAQTSEQLMTDQGGMMGVQQGMMGGQQGMMGQMSQMMRQCNAMMRAMTSAQGSTTPDQPRGTTPDAGPRRE